VRRTFTQTNSDGSELWRVAHQDAAPERAETVTLAAFGQRVMIRRSESGEVTAFVLASTKRSPQRDWEAEARRLLEGGPFDLEGIRSRACFYALREARAGLLVGLRRAGATHEAIASVVHRKRLSVVKTLSRRWPQASGDDLRPARTADDLQEGTFFRALPLEPDQDWLVRDGMYIHRRCRAA